MAEFSSANPAEVFRGEPAPSLDREAVDPVWPVQEVVLAMLCIPVPHLFPVAIPIIFTAIFTTATVIVFVIAVLFVSLAVTLSLTER
jgi:hypothetical protein